MAGLRAALAAEQDTERIRSIVDPLVRARRVTGSSRRGGIMVFEMRRAPPRSSSAISIVIRLGCAQAGLLVLGEALC